jgi:sirohydrochlorin cobaltochelatase
MSAFHRAIILFAHGSRDPAWADSIEFIAKMMRMQLAEQSEAPRIRIAYLELMQPNLQICVQALADEKVTHIQIIPMFLGLGHHAKEDLPKLVLKLQKENQTVRLDLLPAIGENAVLLQSIAQLLIKQTTNSI